MSNFQRVRTSSCTKLLLSPWLWNWILMKLWRSASNKKLREFSRTRGGLDVVRSFWKNLWVVDLPNIISERSFVISSIVMKTKAWDILIHWKISRLLLITFRKNYFIDHESNELLNKVVDIRNIIYHNIINILSVKYYDWN